MKRFDRRKNPKLFGFIWFISVVGILTIMFSVSYLLTDYIYKITEWRLPPLLIQIINSLLGLFLTGSVAGIVGRFARARGWMIERQGFGPIIDALEKIAQGDF